MDFDHIKQFVPFLTLLSEKVPPNRPALTRLIEQSFVGILAGVASAWGTLYIQQGKIEQQLLDMQIQLDHVAANETSNIALLQAQMSAIQQALYGASRK